MCDDTVTNVNGACLDCGILTPKGAQQIEIAKAKCAHAPAMMAMATAAAVARSAAAAATTAAAAAETASMHAVQDDAVQQCWYWFQAAFAATMAHNAELESESTRRFWHYATVYCSSFHHD